MTSLESILPESMREAYREAVAHAAAGEFRVSVTFTAPDGAAVTFKGEAR